MLGSDVRCQNRAMAMLRVTLVLVLECLELAALGDGHAQLGLAAGAHGHALHLAQQQQRRRVQHLSEDDVLAVQPVAGRACEEELAAVRVDAAVGLDTRTRLLHETGLGVTALMRGKNTHHGQKTGLRVLVDKVLVCELVSVDADATSAVALCIRVGYCCQDHATLLSDCSNKPSGNRHPKTCNASHTTASTSNACSKQVSLVPHLHHEVLDHAVERAAFVSDRQLRFPVWQIPVYRQCTSYYEALKQP